MKRFTLFGLLIVLLVTVAIAEPVRVFPGLSDQGIIESKEPRSKLRGIERQNLKI